MTPDLVEAISKLGYGIIGFVFAYYLLKWMLSRLTTNLDKHSESLTELLKDHRQFRTLFKEIIYNLKKLNGKK